MFSSRRAAAGAASSPRKQNFQYSPLAEPEVEIRLLRVLPFIQSTETTTVPSQGQSSSKKKRFRLIRSLLQISSRQLVRDNDEALPDVHCDIFHVRLHEAPPFKALSYTWGSPHDPQYSIMVNGRTILLRQNLFLALQQFHTRPEPLIIWIDALCINQEDDHERNEQVAKMKSVYEHAEEVYVWLGPSEEDSHLAFKLMQEMYDHREDVERINEIFSQPDVKKAVFALDRLVYNDYWWRMWIVQELVSANLISLHCGADAIGAAALDETQSLFRAMENRDRGFRDDHLFNLLPTDLELLNRLGYRGLYDVRMFQNAFETQELSFFQTLLYNWERETTEPEDMVYGLAALANSRSKYHVSINYSLSASEIFIDLAKKELQHCTTLEILTRARSGSNLPGLPSWVPDWSRRDEHNFLYSIIQPEYAYSTAGSSKCNVSISDVGDVLVLQGVVIGTVEIVGECPAMAHWTDLEGAERAFLSWWALLGTTGDRGERRQEQFGRTLVCDKLIDREHEGWGREEFCRSMVGRFVDWIRDELLAEEIGSELVSARSWMLQRYKEVDEQGGNTFAEENKKNVNRSFIQGSANFIWDRRFFLGSYNIMGLATEGVEAGDIICIPLGCPQPMIFRKVEDHYIVIGEAYYDGYMRGKAIEMLENGELELEAFELH